MPLPRSLSRRACNNGDQLALATPCCAAPASVLLRYIIMESSGQRIHNFGADPGAPGRLSRTHSRSGIEAALRPRVREAEGHEAAPSAAIIDSQSVKTTEKGGQGLRCRQEGCWAQASHRSRYFRTAPGRGGTCRQHSRPGWSQAGVEQNGGPVSQTQSDLG